MAVAFAGKFGKPPSGQAFVLHHVRELEPTIRQFGGHMGVDDENFPTTAAHLLNEFTGFIQMVQNAATKNRIEGPVFMQVSYIVADEFQIGKMGACFDKLAVLDIALSDVDADRVKSVAGELNRVSTLEAPEVDDPFADDPRWECKAQKLPGKLH